MGGFGSALVNFRYTYFMYIQGACKGDIHYCLSSHIVTLRPEKICELCNGTTKEYVHKCFSYLVL
jgi:hypothetical protein